MGFSTIRFNEYKEDRKCCFNGNPRYDWGCSMPQMSRCSFSNPGNRTGYRTGFMDLVDLRHRIDNWYDAMAQNKNFIREILNTPFYLNTNSSNTLLPCAS